MTQRKFLVTGGAGFIGDALVQALANQGHFVRSFDNGWRHTGATATPNPLIEPFQGDIRDPNSVNEAARGMDIVCHLAAINGTKHFYEHPDLVLEVGVKGMLNVLDACKSQGIKELITTSSSEAYQTPPHTPTDESVPLIVPDPRNPRYSYGGSKLISELLTLHAPYLNRASIVRPHNVYGPAMGWEHVVPEFIIRMAELCESSQAEINFPIQGSGNETRSFVYVSDMVDGFLKVIENGKHREIYHVGTEDEITIADLAIAIGKTFDRKINLMTTPLTHGSTVRRCPSIQKIQGIGYHPQVSLTEGLAKTARWYTENRHRRPKKMAA